MPTPATTPVAAAVILMAALGTAAAQVAPAPASTIAVPAATMSVKAGWVAQAVSFADGVMGDVPLASVVLGAARDDAFGVLAKQTGGRAGGLVLRGLINAPEDGRYGFVLTVLAGEQNVNCNYALTIDGKPTLADRPIEALHMPLADKAVELAAGRHPILIQVGCRRPDFDRLRVTFKVKLPSAEVAAAPAADFIVHPTRPSGD